MNAEIVKELMTFLSYGSMLTDAVDDDEALEEALGTEVAERVQTFAEEMPFVSVDYREPAHDFLRQQVRESAARLLTLIEAEEGAQPDEVTTEYDEAASE